jgi:CheY-like chemotaxis protein
MALPRVLLVEDHDEVRTMLALALEREGFEVIQAGDGVEALARIDAEGLRPDVVVTDMEMPHLDGLELVARLRSRPDLAGVAVVLVTAIPGDRRVASLREDPLTAVVAKPLRVHTLGTTIRDLMGRAPHPPGDTVD